MSMLIGIFWEIKFKSIRAENTSLVDKMSHSELWFTFSLFICFFLNHRLLCDLNQQGIELKFLVFWKRDFFFSYGKIL